MNQPGNGAATFDSAAREAFEIPREVVYLNGASLAPRLKAVSTAGRAALDRMAQPWGVGSAAWFSDAAALAAAFANIVGASPSCTTLIPSVSYGIAVAARNLPVSSGQNIVLIDQEYPSNYYSWRRKADECGASIRSVRATIGISLTEAILAAIDRETAVVAVANCRWTDGCLVDLERVGMRARRYGAALVVDASQSIGAYPLDIGECRPDFLVSVGYKWLLGPYGLGYLYVAQRWQGCGEPLEESWLNRAGSHNFAALGEYTPDYKPGAARFGQGGSAQFYLLPMAIAALAQIAAWTPQRINRQLSSWTGEVVARAAALGFTALPSSQRAGHMVGLTASSGLPSTLVAELAKRDVYVGARGNSIRIAPHLHVTLETIERLIGALAEIARG